MIIYQTIVEHVAQNRAIKPGIQWIHMGDPDKQPTHESGKKKKAHDGPSHYLW